MNDDLSPETATTSSRRTVLTAAAWTVPVLAAATATPALAASLCTPTNVLLSWANTGVVAQPEPGDNTQVGFSRTFPFQLVNQRPTRSTMNVAVSHAYTGNARSADVLTSTGAVAARNGTRTQVSGVGNVGGTNAPGYTVAQRIGTAAAPIGRSAVTAGDYQTVTFTFPEPVSNVRFSVTDIDRSWEENGTRDFWDAVTILGLSPAPAAGTGFAAVPGLGSTNMVGTGTLANPYRRSVNGNIAEATAGGNLDVTISATITSFQIRYRNYGYSFQASGTSLAPTTDNNQTIFISQMRVDRAASVCL
ncbi:hypothetical protein [Pseudoclavibacter terrae]|uniref:Uncharacterized protein n=1 Tax=Pseudoclavibacter terrae TaxID=1530195 RepID=A0A7J5B4Q3_9MICO|nr:hypothetical protein [Pseudoclavibacter terrae]KAB1639165.1 hypothetical protein F8O03_02140 [Pseudoclavibacter terrae]